MWDGNLWSPLGGIWRGALLIWTSGTTNGTMLPGSIQIPAAGVRRTGIIRANGSVGYIAAAGSFGVRFNSSGGALQGDNTDAAVRVGANASSFAAYARAMLLDLPAGTPATLTFTYLTTAANGFSRLLCTAEMYPSGDLTIF